MKQDAIVNAIEAMAVIGGSSVTTGDSLSATWRLLWTTEKEQLFIIEKAGLFGTRAGEVLQVIDVRKGTLNNVITFPPVIDPSQSTTLSTSLQTCTRLKTFSYKKVVFFSLGLRNVTSEFRDRAPAAMAMMDDVIEKLLVFFRRPKPFFQLLFVTARMSPHLVY
ncbi:hypothetical protein DY000_02004794 [Brassica cretica]|uniref:Plastid lipid-associated protein/fibrillin conserved domain-containing protein n=1 Tax=Brassica cretica TaxID=69181 RepID=A0ABQ7CMR6_BRACR|nr:hypothetical protein DY000_02004794 [Brassica cretica]